MKLKKPQVMKELYAEEEFCVNARIEKIFS